MLKALTDAHAPTEYLEIYNPLLASYREEMDLLSQLSFTYEREPITKTVSATRLDLLRQIQAAHKERQTLISGLISKELELLKSAGKGDK